MKLLAWDTSSKAGALVALEWDDASKEGWTGVKLVTELSLNVDSAHSERLLWGIDQVLAAARWKLEDINVLGVGVGPGSFTGLRIGVTTARTLAHTLGKPLIGVSSLAALARPAALALSSGAAAGKSSKSLARSRAVLVAATDACKGELFAIWGSARSVQDCVLAPVSDSAGLWKRGVEEKVLTPDELVRGIKRKLSEGTGATGWAVVGEGRLRYAESWKKLPQAKRIDLSLSFLDHVQGRYLGQLAWEAYQAGIARDALSVHPRYIRASDAELKLKAGLLPAGPTRGAPKAEED